MPRSLESKSGIGIARGERSWMTLVKSRLSGLPKLISMSFLHDIQGPESTSSSPFLVILADALLPHLQCTQTGAWRWEEELTPVSMLWFMNILSVCFRASE